MTLAAGTRLDSFEIVAPLGAGGMGEVYRARDRVLKRDVAIKVLPEYWSRDPKRLHRFEQEAQAAATLNHPNIVSIFSRRSVRWFAIYRHRIAPRREPARAPASRAHAPTRSHRCRRRYCPWAGRRSRCRNHPPRSQAREHLRNERRARALVGYQSEPEARWVSQGLSCDCFARTARTPRRQGVEKSETPSATAGTSSPVRPTLSGH